MALVISPQENLSKHLPLLLLLLLLEVLHTRKKARLISPGRGSKTRQDHGAIQSGNLSSDHASLHPHGGRTIPSSFVLSIENEGTEDDDDDDDSSFSHGCAVYKLRERWRTMEAHETWLTLLSRSAKRLDNVVYSFFFGPSSFRETLVDTSKYLPEIHIPRSGPFHLSKDPYG